MDTHTEKDYGKVRNNDWKWNPETDRLLEFYKNKYCECGCGNKLHPTRKQVRDSKSKNKPLRVLKGHHNRLPESEKWIKKGKDHPFYGKTHTKEAREKMSKSWFPEGKNHPCWKGGIIKKQPHRKGWLKVRRAVLERDNYTCKMCNEKKDESLLHVHHIVNRHNFKSRFKANSLDNLILLCASCHIKLEDWMRANKNGVNCWKIQNGQSAAKLRNFERFLEGSTVKTEETIMSTSAPLERDDMT
jgi:5-methylcytosine-specific restriction endonuclease McrA